MDEWLDLIEDAILLCIWQEYMVKIEEVVLLLLWTEELEGVVLHLFFVILYLRIANHSIKIVFIRLYPAKYSHVAFEA